MKTLSDLQHMKETPCFPFGNAYTFFIARLADDYLTKTDGAARIEQELRDWTPDARACILELIATQISTTADPDFLTEVIL